MRDTLLALIDARAAFIAQTGREPRELHIPVSLARELAQEMRHATREVRFARPAKLMGMAVLVHPDANTFWVK